MLRTFQMTLVYEQIFTTSNINYFNGFFRLSPEQFFNINEYCDVKNENKYKVNGVLIQFATRPQGYKTFNALQSTKKCS